MLNENRRNRGLMKIKIKKAFRKFTENEEFDFSVLEGIGLVTIVGDNGCGKSSLIHALRGYKNEARTKNLTEKDFQVLAKNIEVEHSYDKIFYYDSVKDNGHDMMVAYDAVNYYDSGGFATRHSSNGEKTLYYLYKFNEDRKKELENPDSKKLLVFDEIDNGLSLKNQVLFFNFIVKMSNYKNCHVMIISHNPFTIAQSLVVYDFTNKKLVKSYDYLKDTTGFSIVPFEKP
jgi:ABC-type multidrug transport system ATPase subunit